MSTEHNSPEVDDGEVRIERDLEAIAADERQLEHDVEKLERDLLEAHRPIHYTVDGHPHETTRADHTAAEILRSDGLDPELYELTEKTDHGIEGPFDRHTEVHIRDGAIFLSVKIRGEVA